MHFIPPLAWRQLETAKPPDGLKTIETSRDSITSRLEEPGMRPETPEKPDLKTRESTRGSIDTRLEHQRGDQRDHQERDLH